MTDPSKRFRGFLPVVVDVETGGLHPATDALLEIAAVIINFDPDGGLTLGDSVVCQVEAFPGARLDPKSLEINGIDPTHPLRPAIPEKAALMRIFRPIRAALHNTGCTRAILVGHNAFFDLSFLNAAVARSEIKRNPFHPFTSFDTATLAGVLLGQTVLARALEVAGIPCDPSAAHSAGYDARVTAELFCLLVNRCAEIHHDLLDSMMET